MKNDNIQNIVFLEAIHLVGEFGGIPCKNPNSEEHGGTWRNIGQNGRIPRNFAKNEGIPRNFAENEGIRRNFSKNEGIPRNFAENEGIPRNFAENGGKWGKTEEFCLFLRTYKFYMQIVANGVGV